MIVFNFLVMKSILIPLQDIKFDFYHVNYKVGEGGSCHTSPIGADRFFFLPNNHTCKYVCVISIHIFSRDLRDFDAYCLLLKHTLAFGSNAFLKSLPCLLVYSRLRVLGIF